jgi:excisionase family DNA binding protein
MSSNIKVQRICQQCGKEFEARTTITRTCSDKCAKSLYKANQRAAKIEASNLETVKTRLKPIEDLKSKEFLTVRDTAILLNTSIRTLYRLIDSGQIKALKLSERKTIIKRSVIDNLFLDPEQLLPADTKTGKENLTEGIQEEKFDIMNSYTIGEILSIFRISEEELTSLISLHRIPKIKKGWDTYLPKVVIDDLLS